MICTHCLILYTLVHNNKYRYCEFGCHMLSHRNLISILFKSTGIYSNIIYVTKAIVTSLTDKNSNKGKTKCRSKYWPIRVVKSNSAILPERKIKEKKFPWIQMIRIRKNVLISIKFLIRIHRNIL